MTIYRDERSAVVRCLAAECMDTTAKQGWQSKYQAGALMPAGPAMSKDDRLQWDCMVHACLHSKLPPRMWYVLVAKYSTHKARKVKSIGRLVSCVESPAPHLFLHKAVTTWAIPQLKGKDGKRSTDMIVLPASFYDMNTWDLEARSERTRRRWRSGICKALDELLSEALIQAQEILLAEEVLVSEVA